MIDAPAAASSDLLNSWKEIAAYLNRGVRTVQRWEADLGLPARRPQGRGRSAVIAMRSEIDAWLKTRLLTLRNQNRVPSNQALIVASQGLRTSVARARVEHRAALLELVNRLEKMTSQSRVQKSA